MSRDGRGRRASRDGRQRGMSLLEVLVSMTLFALVASGMAAMAAASMRATANDRVSGAAQLLASDELERLRGLDYEDIAAGARVVVMAGETFRIATDVSVDDPADGMKRIRVSVSWTGPLGARHHDVETIYTDVG